MVEFMQIATALGPSTASGIWAGVLMFAIYLIREWRETRKLSDADKLARREGYAKQVETLALHNHELLGDLKVLRDEYDKYRIACQTENHELRQSIIELERKVAQLEMKVVSDGR